MAKVFARDLFRQVLLDSDSSRLRSVWIDSCRKRRGKLIYDLILRTEEALGAGDVETIESLLGGDAGVLSSGYEEGCECCGGGSSYIELDLSGVPLPA